MRHGILGRLIGGMLLIGIGSVLILNYFGFTDISVSYLLATYWPLFLIIGGLMHLADGRRSGFFGGLVLILVGGYFLSSNLDLISLSPGQFFRFFFPLMLIVGGLYVLFKPRSHRPHRQEFPPAPPRPLDPPPAPPVFHPEMQSPLDSIFESMGPKVPQIEKNSPHGKYGSGHFDMGNMPGGKAEVMNKSNFIGDVHLGQDYFQLRPMNISHFIGDTIIDLTKAQIPYGETRINVSAFIGDVKVFVPDDMDIGITAASSAFIGDLKILTQNQGGFMSNVEAQTPYYGEAGKRVKLVVSVFIGDVKVNMVG